MKVWELIEQLQQMEQESRIGIRAYDHGRGYWLDSERVEVNATPNTHMVWIDYIEPRGTTS